MVWNGSIHYGYLKVTKDNRLLIGVGDTKVPKTDRRKDPYPPHIHRARRWLKQMFPYLRIEFDYAWSATFGVTRNQRSVIEQKRNNYAIAGTGSQVLCVLAAGELTNRLVGKPHQFNLVFL